MSEQDVESRLRAAGCVYAEDEARLLVREAPDAPTLDAWVERRADGEPLEWILGWADFVDEAGDGIRVQLSPGVFVPRGRTIELALAAAELLGGNDLVLDLCCGSGAIAAFLHDRRPGTTTYAVDLDPAATACARRNLPFATVLTGDLFDPVPTELHERFDVITANTPYVPSDQVALMPSEARDHEPLHTLDGGEDGLDLLRRIGAGATRWLRPGGTVLVEISASQFEAARKAFEAAGLVVSARIDPDGTTVILGSRPDASEPVQVQPARST